MKIEISGLDGLKKLTDNLNNLDRSLTNLGGQEIAISVPDGMTEEQRIELAKKKAIEQLQQNISGIFSR